MFYQTLKEESKKLNRLTEETRRLILRGIAQGLRQKQELILAENAKDLQAAQVQQLSSVIIDRLTLYAKRVEAMAAACEEIANQPAVLGQGELSQRPNGIKVQIEHIPLGVLAMVFESRPNVVVDAMSLCIKSGNALILKGGKEARYSNQCLFHLVDDVFYKITSLRVFHYLESRDEFHHLLSQNHYIDLVIARGSSQLVDYVKAHATMPVMAHDKGLCHLYIHSDAPKAWVEMIVLNAKTSRPSVCNALETLLIHEQYPHTQDLINLLLQAGVKLKGNSPLVTLNSQIELALDKDYDTEYLDLILSMKLVSSLQAAITHIHQHTSYHTEGIIAQDASVIEEFRKSIDASCIVVNASTRFNDGAELGLGAELGISTSKFHAYGPVGASQMTTKRFVVLGSGAIRA